MKIFFLLIPLAFLSCNAAKNSDTLENKTKETIISLNKDQSHNIEISINTREPYCGGAAPREEDLNRVSVGEFSYLLINTNNNDTSTIKSDSLGFIYLNLKIGNYEIREMYKDLSLAQFKKNNQPNKYQALSKRDPDCYEKWWLENLLKFEVAETAELNKHNVTINKMCRTGLNPCVTFTGRLPN